MDPAGHGALITGGASGLGLATAKALAARGARVVILDLARSNGEAEAAALKGKFVAGDVTSEADVAKAVAAADDLRVVVNCAGIGPSHRIVSRNGPHPLDAFKRVMEETRRVRLSQGAIEWALLHHVSEPSRYVEQILDESWTEHLRRFGRATAADITLRERRLAFHVGEGAPVVNRFIVQR